MDLVYYICPDCQRTLTFASCKLNCDCGRNYSVTDGIVNFLNTTQYSIEETKTIQEYNELAASYDDLMSWVFNVFGENENTVRRAMVDKLDVKPNSRILEIGCGTGSDSIHIYEKTNRSGELFLVEISESMIRMARNKMNARFSDLAAVFYALADVGKLPFPDDFFDAAFHFGGLNVFPDKKKAMNELNRVVKTGGKVVVGDESVPPWLRETKYGKTLMEYNSQYKHQVPLEIIPENAGKVNVQWLLGNSFYLIDYVVSDKSLGLNMDLKNPYFNKSIREWLKEKSAKA